MLLLDEGTPGGTKASAAQGRRSRVSREERMLARLMMTLGMFGEWT